MLHLSVFSKKQLPNQTILHVTSKHEILPKHFDELQQYTAEHPKVAIVSLNGIGLRNKSPKKLILAGKTLFFLHQNTSL